MKRLRQAGNIPAVLYGHKEGNVLLSVAAKDINRAINDGSYVVELAGAASDSALIKEVQWDAFGINVVHVDFTRVDANEKVEVTLPIVLKGDAIGTHHGGEINFHQHELTIACPALKVPDKIELRISELDIDQTISAGDVPLPEGAELAEAATTPIVSCAPKAEAADDDDGDDAAASDAPAEEAGE
jgi:large subunit ribosomal protein L25